MTDDSELTVFPSMSKSEFIEFLERAQEEYKKNKTLSEDFITKEFGKTGSIEEGAKRIITIMEK